METREKLDLFLKSKKFNIPTKEILNLQQEVLKWLDNNALGAIIYGRPRIGKTRAIQYITKSLRAKYGNSLPIFTINAYDHIPSINQFYTDFLLAINHPVATKGNAAIKKERLINALLSAALDTEFRRIILFIDEAFNYREKDYNWLMHIYNELNTKDVQLTVFMVGTKELKNSKTALIHAKQQQIVGRFMVNEYEFNGISSTADIQICLSSYDKYLEDDQFSNIILTEFYFPEAYKDNIRLISCASTIMEEFTKLMASNDIDINSDIPMQYFINLINYCLKKFGKYGKGVYFPNAENWREAILESGYIAAERCEIELSMSF